MDDFEFEIECGICESSYLLQLHNDNDEKPAFCAMCGEELLGE